MNAAQQYRGWRLAGGTAAWVGSICVLVAIWVPWLNVHIMSDEPQRLQRVLPDDTVPRSLSELSTRGWVFGGLAALVLLAVGAATRKWWVRRFSGLLALPAAALSVVASLDAAGTIRWWGGSALTRHHDDKGLAVTLAHGSTWAVSAVVLLALGVITLACTTPPPRRKPSDEMLVRASGFVG